MNRNVDNSFMENEFTIYYRITCVTPRRGAGRRGARASRRLPSAPLCPHIRAMPKPAKPGPPPSRAKASRPDVQPLDEHLAALLNPALIDKPQAASAKRRRRASRRSPNRIRAA